MLNEPLQGRDGERTDYLTDKVICRGSSAYVYYGNLCMLNMRLTLTELTSQEKRSLTLLKITFIAVLSLGESRGEDWTR